MKAPHYVHQRQVDIQYHYLQKERLQYGNTQIRSGLGLRKGTGKTCTYKAAANNNNVKVSHNLFYQRRGAKVTKERLL